MPGPTGPRGGNGCLPEPGPVVAAEGLAGYLWAAFGGEQKPTRPCSIDQVSWNAPRSRWNTKWELK